jgi:hypothetical protein
MPRATGSGLPHPVRLEACGDRQEPASSLQRSSSSRAAGIMVTSDRPGLRPSTRSNPSRMLASGTERKRSPNEAPAPHAACCFGNEKRQAHHPPGPSGKALKSPKPEPRNPARSSRVRWRGTGRAPTTRLFERVAEILGGTEASSVPRRSKAQGSNERQPVATPSAAADLNSGAKP